MRFLKLGFAALVMSMLCSSPLLAEEIKWSSADGTTKSLADYRGKPVILHFWASWCFQCRAELPGLEAWIKANPDVTVIPVSVDDDISYTLTFLESKEIDIPAWQTNFSKATAAFVLRGLPTTLVIGADGETLKKKTGALHWDRAEAVAPLLQAYHSKQVANN